MNRVCGSSCRYEEQAYGLDGRFTKDPSNAFSVEAEVREWIRTGRF
jgi:hypothetical protein